VAKKAGASRKTDKKSKKTKSSVAAKAVKPAKSAKASAKAGKPVKDSKRASSAKAADIKKLKSPPKETPAKEPKEKPTAKKPVVAPKAPTEKPAKAAAERSAKAAEKPAKGAKLAEVAATNGTTAEAKKDDAKKVDDKKDAGRKGITIVTPKPMKRPKAAPAVAMPTGLGRLLDPKGPARKPLIPSGPKSPPSRALGQHGGPEETIAKPELKTHLGKKELEHFRALLIRKRAELVGDVSTMEKEALRGETGSLSNVPSHMAEQGSDASEQSLSLDLAAADRKLIREIDDALNRIADGTYGVCELTGKPIRSERLEELPWARHSIEAARELERLAMRG
jgi:RNA polymerase-binding protein DksA